MSTPAAARDARLELRLSDAEKDTIAQAADASGENLSSFLRRIALAEARRIQAKSKIVTPAPATT